MQVYRNLSMMLCIVLLFFQGVPHAEDPFGAEMNLYISSHGVLHGDNMRIFRDRRDDKIETQMVGELLGEKNAGKLLDENAASGASGFEPGAVAVFGFGIIGFLGILRWRLRN